MTTPENTPTTEQELEQRILDGDESITADDLAAASIATRFARLRATASRNKQAKAEQAERDKQEHALRENVTKAKDKLAAKPMIDAQEQLARDVTKAVEKFAKAVDDRDKLARELLAQAKSIGVPSILTYDQETPRPSIYIRTGGTEPRLIIDGAETVQLGAGVAQLDRLIRESVKEPAKRVKILGADLSHFDRS